MILRLLWLTSLEKSPFLPSCPKWKVNTYIREQRLTYFYTWVLFQQLAGSLVAGISVDIQSSKKLFTCPKLYKASRPLFCSGEAEEGTDLQLEDAKEPQFYPWDKERVISPSWTSVCSPEKQRQRPSLTEPWKCQSQNSRTATLIIMKIW